MKSVVLLVLIICVALNLNVGNSQLLFDWAGTYRYSPYQWLNEKDQASVSRLLQYAIDVIRNTDERMASLEWLRYNMRKSAAFEIGYLNKVAQELYRKQVDKYNTSKYMFDRLYMNELVLYLEEIEHHYWEVEHVVNMLHEVEKKYGVKGGFEDDYDVYEEDIKMPRKVTKRMPVVSVTSGSTVSTRATTRRTTTSRFTISYYTTRPTTRRRTQKSDKKAGKWDFQKAKQQHATSGYTRSKRKGRFPLDYGWDISNWK